MRIGVMGDAVNGGTIEQIIDEARRAADDGLDTYWVPQIFGHDALTALAVVGRVVEGIELGTAVVPTYPRHPMMLAQQALTVQSAISTAGGQSRLALGIGLSHQIVVEMMWGLSFDKPVRHLREYLSVMMPLLEGKPASFSGDDYRVHGGLTISGIERPSVLVAALGTQMLRVTGTLADGTSTWCVGPRTLADHTVPTLAQAAADAGRGAPRVVASFPVCVTDDVDAALARAEQVFALYNTLPSYKAMMDREGVGGPKDLAIVGPEDEVRDRLADLASVGVTDLNAAVFPGTPDESLRTRDVLRSLVT
jgi:5,10-methylenetetrahydromethanopterin reductase